MPLHSSRLSLHAILLAALITACGRAPDELVATARQHLQNNNTAAAVIELKNALKENPNHAEARFLLGRAMFETGDITAAEVELGKAKELGYPPEVIAPWLIRIALATGQASKAIAEFSSLVTTTPESSADLKTALALAYFQTGKPAEGKQALQEALRAKPDHAPALLAEARLLATEQGLPAALARAETLSRQFPTNFEAWHFLADLKRLSGDVEAARAAYRKVLELKPKVLTAHASLIEMAVLENRLEEAEKQLEALQKVAPQHPLTSYLRASLAFVRKDLATAKTAIDAVLKNQPDNPLALQLAGAIAFAQGSDLQAQDHLAKALQKAPALDYARRTLTLSYLRSHQPTKALTTLQPVLRGDETNPVWLSLAGEVFMANGDAQTAADYFSRASKANPRDAWARTALAMTKMRLGQTQQAFADLDQIATASSDTTADMALIAASLQQKKFDQALLSIDRLEKKQPDSPVPHNLRGMTRLAQGDKTAARASFEKALALDPTFFPAAASLARLDLAEKQPEKARQRYATILAKEPRHVQALLASAELALRSNSHAEAAEAIEKAIAAAPSDPRPRLALIDFHVRTKDIRQALKAAQEALAALPDQPEILDAAARVYLLGDETTRKVGEALATYTRLATLLPSSPYPYLRMAEIQLANKDFEGARASLKKGIAFLPKSLALQRASILLDLAERKFADALTKARTLQKDRPKESVGWLLEGEIHTIRQDWTAASNAFRTALKIAPTNAIAEKLYLTLLQGGKPTEAKGFAEGWLREHPKDAAFRLFLADVANRQGNYATAVSHYRVLLADGSDNPALLNNLAWSLGQMNDPQALDFAEAAYRKAPDQPAIQDTLGWLLVKTNRDPARGLQLLANAVAAAPDAHEIRLNYARALLKSGDKTKARAELERLSKLDARHPIRRAAEEMLQGL